MQGGEREEREVMGEKRRCRSITYILTVPWTLGISDVLSVSVAETVLCADHLD